MLFDKESFIRFFSLTEEKISKLEGQQHQKKKKRSLTIMTTSRFVSRDNHVFRGYFSSVGTLLLFFSMLNSAPEVSGSSSSSSSSSSKCGVYLAPSTIPGSGLGMYAGHNDYNIGEQVTYGDVVIPIIEMDWNNRFNNNYDFLWDEYTWNAEVFPGMEEEVDDMDLINCASPGVGAAANSYLSLVNLEDDYVQLSRVMDSTNPGVGGITPYYGRSFKADKLIKAGQELFVSYGENYFETRPETYGYIPMPRDYKRADKLLKKMKKLQTKVNPSIKTTTTDSSIDNFWIELYNFVQTQPSIWTESRVLNALPSNFSNIPNVLETGGTSQQHLNHSIRPLDWLEEHGQCMDNIKDGISTNPNAGRGAFATRFIPKGGLVAPAPLIQISNRTVLQVHEPIDDHDGGVDPDVNGPKTDQLLINYCFGHHKSTLLLCPYGLLTALINHSKDKPNAKIQWSERMRHKEWLDQPLKKWGKKYHHTGLAFDFIALRDIEEGEEIFIDYGDVWEEAWQYHKANFVPRKNYIPAFELNDMADLQIRTIDERPYEKDGVKLWCRGYFKKNYGISESNNDSRCRVLKRRNNNSYTVQIFYEEDDDNDNDDGLDKTVIKNGKILWDVPRDALYFEDMSYMRDHYRFWAFRHPMMIPDTMFPDHWKNL